MKISVKAHTKSKTVKIVRISEQAYEVWIHEPPDKGKANKAVVETVAQALGVAKSRCKIISGLASRSKIIEVS